MRGAGHDLRPVHAILRMIGYSFVWCTSSTNFAVGLRNLSDTKNGWFDLTAFRTVSEPTSVLRGVSKQFRPIGFRSRVSEKISRNEKLPQTLRFIFEMTYKLAHKSSAPPPSRRLQRGLRCWYWSGKSSAPCSVQLLEPRCVFPREICRYAYVAFVTITDGSVSDHIGNTCVDWYSGHHGCNFETIIHSLCQSDKSG